MATAGSGDVTKEGKVSRNRALYVKEQVPYRLK
jgi:hypothetical protein